MRNVITLLFISLSPCLLAKPEAYFSPRGGIQRQILRAIDQSQRSIEVALFDLSSSPLMQALVRAGQRGVTVRLLVDAHVLHEHPTVKRLGSLSNIHLQSLKGQQRRHGLMHHKFAIFDETRIVTGSYNWTNGAEYANYENALFEDDPAVVQTYKRQFDQLWVQRRDFSIGHPTRRRSHLSSRTRLWRRSFHVDPTKLRNPDEQTTP